MGSKIRIFMVEDDHNFGAVLKSYLEIHDYYVHWVDDGKHAVKEFRTDDFDVCILDVMLPNVDGFQIAREIRFINKNVPLIFLTAKTLKEDILTGYKLGADDYITKPFDSEVLLYKIQAVLKRNDFQEKPENGRDEFEIGTYRFNYPHRMISRGEQLIKLSPREAELLRLLCLKINDVMPREMALKKIWGEDSYFTTRSMDVFITKLRKYLKDDPAIEIVNIHGSGFKLTVN
ncbi:MAG: DNA-binding response regulator [Bacteroidetes bacterium 4572_114]|nr:MAG: DNA-binding response regulator [Bacteroidetes bacterium 4572_114]